MSWPESAPAANRVLRAAEKWRMSRTARDLSLAWTDDETNELASAVDAYMATAYLEQTTVPKEAGD